MSTYAAILSESLFERRCLCKLSNREIGQGPQRFSFLVVGASEVSEVGSSTPEGSASSDEGRTGSVCAEPQAIANVAVMAHTHRHAVFTVSGIGLQALKYSPRGSTQKVSARVVSEQQARSTGRDSLTV